MIYRDAGVAVRQALAGNKSDAEVGELHPEHFTRLELGLAPDTAVFDRWIRMMMMMMIMMMVMMMIRWRLYRIHHFAVVAEQWPALTRQVTGGKCSVDQHSVLCSLSASEPTPVWTGCTGLCRWQTGTASNNHISQHHNSLCHS